MSQQNKQASTSTLADPPAKRKRGRPRKDESLVQKEKAAQPPQPAPSVDVRSNQHAEFDPSNDIDDDMVGQVVSGVIEGSFDAGYFLSVRAGNTGTLFRGVVFQPGLFTPITAANDIAPNAKMYQRREFPIPVFNLQSQVNGSTSIPQPERNNEQPVQLENQAPTVPAQVLPSELQSGSPFAFASPSARDSHHCRVWEGSGVCSLTPVCKDAVSMAKNESDAFMGGKDMPEENSEFGLEKQSTPRLQSGASFALANQSAPDLVPLTDVRSLTPVCGEAVSVEKNESVTFMEGKTIPEKKSEFGLEKQSTPRLQSAASFALADQSASVKVPQTDTLLKIDPRKDMPQQISEFGLENQSTPWLQSDALFHRADQSACGKLHMTDYLSTSLGAKNVPKQNFENQFGHQLRSGASFPLTTQSAYVTVPGKDMPKQNSGSAFDNQSKPKLQSGTPFTLTKLSASVTVPLSNDLSKNNLGASLIGKDVPRKNFESLLNHQPIPHMQTGTPFGLTNQSVMVPPTDSLPKNDSGASLGGKNVPQQNSEFGFGNLSTKQDEIKQELEASSTLLERRNIDGEGTKDVILQKASEPTIDIFRGMENINQVHQVQHQAVDSGLESSKLVHDELMSGIPELQQTLVDAKPRYVSPEKPISPENGTPQIMQSESTNNLGRDEKFPKIETSN